MQRCGYSWYLQAIIMIAPWLWLTASSKVIVFISLNKSYWDFLSLPLFNVEFFTGPVVAIREMTNTQVTPEFEDFAAAWFLGHFFHFFFSLGKICSAISVALKHNPGHIARGNCGVEIIWSPPALIFWGLFLKSINLNVKTYLLWHLIKAETLVICVASLVVAKWCLDTVE